MTHDSQFRAMDISRRRLLRGAAVAVGGGVLLVSGATSADAAQTKVSQKLVNYQATPQGRARCDNCLQWQPPSSCKLVQGAISPSGWCTLYAPQPKS